jgi:single-strand DNA-binding protein
MTKGQPALLEGRLHMNQWTTQEGEKRTKHEVIVENFQFLGGPRAGEGGGRGMAEPEAPYATAPTRGPGSLERESAYPPPGPVRAPAPLEREPTYEPPYPRSEDGIPF